VISKTERAELDHLRESLGGWALGDVKKAVSAGIKVGAFILAASLIDALARLAYSRRAENARAAWDEFVPAYLRRYDGHAHVLYRGFRSAVSHNYSLDGIRLTDGPAHADRYWRVEEGERVLHLETFVVDLERAFDTFIARLERDEALRHRVLDRVRGRPLLGIVGGYGDLLAASASWSPTTAVATYFGSAVESATGSAPRMAIPRKPKRKRRA
jgi:hypothetical protein